MAALKASGLGGKAKIYTKDDIEKMTANMGGGSVSSSNKS